MTATKTILVVDDDHDLRRGLSAVLQNRGFRTLEAEDGQEAEVIIQGQRPDLVILDMMMPRWGGFVVLEHFQGQKNAPPFIMITANDGEKHKAYAQKIGAVDYFRKPFPMEKLLDGVDKILGKPASAVSAASTRNRPPVRITCSGCGARIKAPTHMLGQTHACPGCKTSFVVRREPPEDAGPMLVADDPARRPG